MNRTGPAFYHQLFGDKKPKAVYYKRDFPDYALMIVISAVVFVLAYGPRHIFSIAGVALCVFELAMFIVRHGFELRVPLILRRPQDVLYMVLYKLGNLRPAYFLAIGVLLLENFLIGATPAWPHRVELMRRIFLGLFYLHFIGLTLFRTASLVDHFAKKELVREVLMQTPWQRVIKHDTNVVLEILHAYSTGVLTHIIVLAPWYLVITHSSFSLVFLAATCVLNVMVYGRWLKVVNSWFYRDHWLGHNSELEFIFLHGPHHDAIPSGLIAVGENGFLEGFLRFAIGSPVAFFSPLLSFMIYTIEVKKDLVGHQYIPGIFPRISRDFMEVYQHPTHHYGPITPYSFGFKFDQPHITEEKRKAIGRIRPELENSAKLDEELTGFQWDNPTYRRTLSLFEKYQK